jgi:hypothetical protein
MSVPDCGPGAAIQKIQCNGSQSLGACDIHYFQGAIWLWSCDSCLRMRKVKEHYEMSKMRLNTQFDSIRWRAD